METALLIAILILTLASLVLAGLAFVRSGKKDSVSHELEEKLSRASRFGVAINYSSPNREQYYDIVRGLAARAGRLDLPEEGLLLLANRWEIRHGGVSGRTAQQFINYLAGKETPHADT